MVTGVALFFAFLPAFLCFFFSLFFFSSSFLCPPLWVCTREGQ